MYVNTHISLWSVQLIIQPEIIQHIWALSLKVYMCCEEKWYWEGDSGIVGLGYTSKDHVIW